MIKSLWKTRRVSKLAVGSPLFLPSGGSDGVYPEPFELENPRLGFRCHHGNSSGKR